MENDRNQEKPYIDLRDQNLKNFTAAKKIESEGLMLESGDFIVVLVQEDVEIPDGHIGVMHGMMDGLLHTTAILVYPRGEGKLALEFRVFKKTVMVPGMLAAVLSAHRSVNPLTPYEGRYQNQHTVTPR